MPHVSGTCLVRVLFNAPQLWKVENADNISDWTGVPKQNCCGLTTKERDFLDRSMKTKATSAQQHMKGPHDCAIESRC